jgi:hypothetical protein
VEWYNLYILVFEYAIFHILIGIVDLSIGQLILYIVLHIVELCEIVLTLNQFLHALHRTEASAAATIPVCERIAEGSVAHLILDLLKVVEYAGL